MNNILKPIILAVDDKPELLTAIVNMLNEHYTVIALTSGEAAIKAIEKHTPVLFILDIEMPVMDGYELAYRLRSEKRFEKTPIIFLTAQSSREHIVSAVMSGGNDYLVKPVSKDLLLNKIQKLL